MGQAWLADTLTSEIESRFRHKQPQLISTILTMHIMAHSQLV